MADSTNCLGVALGDVGMSRLWAEMSNGRKWL
jgi:hypothetical protein